jgi:hypothetical protein
MTFNPASRDERMAARASRACALSVSFTCANRLRATPIADE